MIRNAIQEIKDLFFVISHTQDIDKSQIIHRIFQVRPASSEDQFWESHLVEPVSAWAFSEMLNELRKQNMAEAYRFYCTIKGPPESVDGFLKFIFTVTWKYLGLSLSSPSITPLLLLKFTSLRAQITSISKTAVSQTTWPRPFRVIHHGTSGHNLPSFHPLILSCTYPEFPILASRLLLLCK